MGKLGGGDFVVIGTSGTTTTTSTSTISATAFRETVCQARGFVPAGHVDDPQRRALFIAGGDQSRYVRFWKHPVEDAISYVAAKPAPIGGTSAGMAVMGEFLYSSMTENSLTAETALADPYARDVTLDRDFLVLPKLAGILTDQHLHERDRIGRTVAMLARLVADGWTAQGRAIAADRETALHVDPATGAAEVYATAKHTTPYVYFMSTPGQPEICKPGVPLTFRNIAVYRIGPGGHFDLDRWQGQGGIAYTLSAEAGVLSSSRSEIY
jgi:cyanophycinase-like exopeptidase